VHDKFPVVQLRKLHRCLKVGEIMKEEYDWIPTFVV
jgi:hypothetical protein